MAPNLQPEGLEPHPHDPIPAHVEKQIRFLTWDDVERLAAYRSGFIASLPSLR
jgi:hypothetical protein